MEKRVLVVDDQDNWRKMIAVILRDNGYSVDAVSSFTQAIKKIQNNDYNLAVIDVRLDDSEVFNVEGIELLEHLRGENIETKKILMTGYKETFDKIDIKEHGADLLILKVPEGNIFDRWDFINNVNDLLR